MWLFNHCGVMVSWDMRFPQQHQVMILDPSVFWARPEQVSPGRGFSRVFMVSQKWSLFLGIVPGIPAMPLPSLSTLSGPVCSLQISVTFTFLSLSVLLKDFSSLGFVNVLGCVRSVQVVNKCSSPAIKLRRNSLLTFPGGAILSPLVLTFVALHSFSCTLNRILGVYCDTAAFYFF